MAKIVLLPTNVRDALLSIMVSKKIARQAAFAKALKLSTGYVCDVLACRRNLSPDVIDRIGEKIGLTRKQVFDLHHRAAIVAGWKLPNLPEDQQVDLVKAEPGALMRVKDGTKPKAKKVAKAKPVKKAAAPKKAKVVKAKPAPKAKKVAAPKPAKKVKANGTAAAPAVQAPVAPPPVPTMPEPVAQPAPDDRE